MRISHRYMLLYGMGFSLLVGLLILTIGGMNVTQAGYGCGGWIEDGDLVYDAIRARGYSCEYFFTAQTGDIVTITMKARSSSLDPYLTLYDPYGNAVAYNNNYTRTNQDSQISAYRPVRRGTYTIEAGSYQSRTYGNFSLALDIR